MKQFLNRLWSQRNTLFLRIFYLPRNVFFVIFRFYLDRKIIKKINYINLHNKNNEEISLNEIFLLTSFKIDNEERCKILESSTNINFENLHNSNIKVQVYDASDDIYFKKNQEVFKNIKGINLDYQSKKERLTTSYYNLLSQSKEKYFCSFFDDMPIVGLTREFLLASERLLRDFDGSIPIVIEQIIGYDCDHKNRQILFNCKNILFKNLNKKPLGIIKYGNVSFAILYNYHYGFFFNTIIARCDNYKNKLIWYMNKISQNSPHQIELAGMRKIGPVYQYVAVPLEVFALDLDYIHSKISIRKENPNALKLFSLFVDKYKKIVFK